MKKNRHWLYRGRRFYVQCSQWHKNVNITSPFQRVPGTPKKEMVFNTHRHVYFQVYTLNKVCLLGCRNRSHTKMEMWSFWRILSLAAMKIAILTTFGAASGKHFTKMTFAFQCTRTCEQRYYKKAINTTPSQTVSFVRSTWGRLDQRQANRSDSGPIGPTSGR